MANHASTAPLESDPQWYKDAIIYEVHPRAFYDSEADGIGDFRGLTQKLDYLRDLGVTAVWLLPFYPSPLKDDGYDIADYVNVHPAYGSLRDVEIFLREAHRHGLRVITELVLNHTSEQHMWFQRARRAKAGSLRRNFYVWSDTPNRYGDARIIFKDFESSNWTWDAVAQAYYWHRFYSHQPDLNFDNAAVRRAIMQVVDFWLRLGVDGLRLDAVPYLYERDGTNCENLAETHAFLKSLRHHIDLNFSDRMLLAEANQWPEDAVAYFGGGDECQMAFHFPLMPRMFMAIHMEDRLPIIDILQQTPAIPDACQWALFLRNHDELTLEMVTDEERDYMYRVYAHDRQARINLGIRRRLAPLLGNHRRKVELMNGLLLSLPGTPIIYYGDEIGMGDNIYLGDRNGVRTPMQWSADRNFGFSRANPQQLYLPVVIDPEYHPATVNVEAQQSNPHSLLWWMKRLIALRKRYAAFGRGSIELLLPDNRKVLVFLRRYRDETLLIVANLSRFVQYVELDLSAYQDMVPVELFGSTPFPRIGALPYFLSLGPHSFYWFALQPPHTTTLRVRTPETEAPQVRVDTAWEEIFADRSKLTLENLLPEYLPARRWFGAKAQRIKTTEVIEAVRLAWAEVVAYVAFIRVAYVEGEPETYLLPLTFATGAEATQLAARAPQAVLAHIRMRATNEEGVLYDASWDLRFAALLLDAVTRRRRFRGRTGEVLAASTRALRHLHAPTDPPLAPALMKVEQSNTSFTYGDRLILKLFRRVDEGINPDLEIGRFLTERRSFAHVPPVAGFLSYTRDTSEPTILGIVQGFVPNQGDAWTYTLDMLQQYFERALAHAPQTPPEIPIIPLLQLAQAAPPELAHQTIGGYLEAARLLGQRTAELHQVLASESEDPAFTPEPFTSFYQRSLYQSMRNLAAQALGLLRTRLRSLPEAARSDAQRVLELETRIDSHLRLLLARKSTALRIRCHGDYHLGQVLYTGRDFVIIDFEGEPARSLTERRLKRSPLRDVSGMLRSYHYAVYDALQSNTVRTAQRSEDLQRLEPWARFWYLWVAATFLRAYLDTAAGALFLPHTSEESQILLDAYMLEKSLYEVHYELNHRPDWVHIPLLGILSLLQVNEPAEGKRS